MAYTTIDKPTDYFETNLHTGTGSTHNITSLDFAPDFVWLKSRTQGGTGYNGMHYLFDTIRGATKRVRANDNSAEATSSASLTAFNSDGYTLGTDEIVNKSGDAYVGWSWLGGGTASSNSNGSITSSVSASTTSGFSIVSYTGTGANATVGHGLGVAPKMIHIKNRTTARGWISGHESIGWTKNLYLDGTNAEDTRSDTFNNTSPTSSVFSIGSSVGVNENTDSMIAYCFAEKQGYSKFGSYTGNGSASDGVFIYTGFKPAFVMVKRTDSTANWQILDNKRNTYNPWNTALFPDTSEPDTTDYSTDHLSNGFKLRVTTTSRNGSGASYIYMAFAENPFVTSTGVPATAR